MSHFLQYLSVNVQGWNRQQSHIEFERHSQISVEFDIFLIVKALIVVSTQQIGQHLNPVSKNSHVLIIFIEAVLSHWYMLKVIPAPYKQ